MITSPPMFLRRFPADPFLLGVALAALLATAFAISPSSYGIVLRQLGAADDGVLLGEPRPIRSDEYALWTPMLQAAAAGGYGQTNDSSLYGESQRHLYPLPLYDWGLAFKPTFWPFLFLPAPHAYAAYFAAYTFLFLAGYYLLGQRFGLGRLEAALAALLLYYSAYTQTWWTSLGHHLAIFPWVLLLYLAELKPAARAALATLAAAAWFLAGTFYPPLVWTLLLCGALGLWVFRPEMARLAPELRWRQAAMLLGLFAGAVIAYLYLREPLAAALASSGHGRRHEAGGHVPWLDFLGLFFPLLSYKGSIIISGTNHCEASTGGSLLWPLLLFFVDWSATRRALAEHPERAALRRRLWALGAALALLSAWMLLPLPAWLGLPFLWHKFPNSRLLFPAGLLCLWLAFLLFRVVRFRFAPARLALFCAAVVLAWWPSRITASFEWLASGFFRDVWRIEWRDHANSDLFPAFLLVVLALAAYLLRRRTDLFRRLLSPAGALGIAALANAFFFLDFNPWMSARPIFARQETPQLAQLRELAAAHPQGWLVIGGFEYLGRTLNGQGFRAANHGFIVPETRQLREIFPQLGARAFDDAFNRYCLVQVALFRPPGKGRLREPLFQGGDLTLMPADAFLPETRLLLRDGPPAAPLPPRGEILGLRLDGKSLHLSFAGEINGSAGSTEVTLYLDRPGRVADRWLRPRADGFDLSQGLRLFSRLDLEIELGEAPASLAELGLCIETRDPGFGSYAIAPAGAARSLCP